VQVLIVEDDLGTGNLLREHLDAEGYVAEVVGTTAEARRSISTRRPDLILLDLVLPIENGWTFLQARQLDTLLAGIPVLAISAAPQARLFEARDLGADAFISKPFDLDVVTAVVRSFVV
jgi:DNA-binding response OmpR family regulator